MESRVIREGITAGIIGAFLGYTAFHFIAFITVGIVG
jgi:hypothetical protein